MGKVFSLILSNSLSQQRISANFESFLLFVFSDPVGHNSVCLPTSSSQFNGKQDLETMLRRMFNVKATRASSNIANFKRFQ